jgi:hypothetical protein
MAAPVSAATLDLSAVPIQELVVELKRRAYVVLPRGVLELAIADAKAEGVKEYEADKVDAGPVLDELCQLAGEALPEAVAQVLELSAENHELQRRAARAESELNALLIIALDELAGDGSED